MRILDSVLPHEVTHTIFATHFRRPLPRWADEGACTTVEHHSERQKQQMFLIDFLHTGRGIAFNQMFAMKEYPQDVMPLYSQGYSLARYLVVVAAFALGLLCKSMLVTVPFVLLPRRARAARVGQRRRRWREGHVGAWGVRTQARA